MLQLRVGSIREMDIEAAKHAHMSVLLNSRMFLGDGVHGILKHWPKFIDVTDYVILQQVFYVLVGASHGHRV